MRAKGISKLLIAIFIALAGSFVLCAILSLNVESFDFIQSIAGTSSFFVAILTVIYVYTSTKQMDLMQRQLSEMTIERQSREQPIPSIENLTFLIQQPRFFIPHQMIAIVFCHVIF